MTGDKLNFYTYFDTFTVAFFFLIIILRELELTSIEFSCFVNL